MTEMWDRSFMVDEIEGTKSGKCSAPAAGCFGQLRSNEAHGAKPKRSAEEVFQEWESVAARFYMMGYRDGAGREA